MDVREDRCRAPCHTRHGLADALLEAVGPERQDRVFAALVKILHLDAGGDTQLMQ